MCHILALRLWCTLGYTYFVNMQFCTVSVVFASKKYEDNDLILLTFNVQPIGRFQGQATDVDIARKEIRNVKIEMVFFPRIAYPIFPYPFWKKELIISA